MKSSMAAAAALIHSRRHGELPLLSLDYFTDILQLISQSERPHKTETETRTGEGLSVTIILPSSSSQHQCILRRRDKDFEHLNVVI